MSLVGNILEDRLLIYRRREHVDFAESTEEIAPLTDAEKKAKLAELRERAKERQALKEKVDKEEAKKNEVSLLLPNPSTVFLLPTIANPFLENQNEVHARNPNH